MSRAKAAHWEFTRRFRRGAFGWKSQPAIARVRQAVSEIKMVARHDPVLAAEGAVLFLERVSAALEHVDSSSAGSSVGSWVSDFRHTQADSPRTEIVPTHATSGRIEFSSPLFPS